MNSKRQKDKIIVALDVPTAEEARRHIKELRGEVGAFKIGLQLITSEGVSFIREVVEDGIKLFLDTKFHDIPATVAKASVETARLGVWMFNIHASGGSEMLHQTVEAVNEVCEKENLVKPKIIGVTVLTSSNQKTLNEVGVGKDINKQVLELTKLSAGNSLDGVVSSPKETALIRENIPDKNFTIVTPGIRPSFSALHDQKRVMTPKEAVENGTDYMVIGRPILQSPNPVEAVKKIVGEITF